MNNDDREFAGMKNQGSEKQSEGHNETQEFAVPFEPLPERMLVLSRSKNDFREL
jgi:hypothetical protein